MGGAEDANACDGAAAACANCGAEVPHAVAGKTGGLCLACFFAADVPADAFDIPDDIAARIEAMNLDPAAIGKLLRLEDAAFVHHYLDRLDRQRD